MTDLARRLDDDALATLGANLYASGCFPDVKTGAQAVVKILADAEYGLPPLEAMRSFHIMRDGRISPSASLLARAVKASERYDYTVVELTDDRCELTFWADGDEAGASVFTIEDARRAGILGNTWEKYPRNMLFARAITNGVDWFCPDVLTPITEVPTATSAPAASLPTQPEPARGRESEADTSVAAGTPSGSDEALAYGEGASGSEEPANVEEAEAAAAGDTTPRVARSEAPEPLASASSHEHPGPHMWKPGQGGLEFCAYPDCLATRRGEAA